MNTRALLHETWNRACNYIEAQDERPVQGLIDYEALRASLAIDLGEEGVPGSQVIAELAEAVEPGLVNSTSPRFFGWVIGGTLPAALAADWMTSTWDQNSAAFACSPALGVVDEICGGWLKDILGLPATASHGFVTGCQMAHVTALAAARYRLLERRGIDVHRDGLWGAPPIRVVTGEHHHETFERALRHLGMGTRHIERVPLGADGAMDVSAAKRALENNSDSATILCLQAGDLNTGRFDDFAQLSSIGHKVGAWVHVDGAFGLWARACPDTEHLVRGIDSCDSWATDGHKWLNVPYDSGFVFVADANAHHSAMSMAADYVPEGHFRNPMDYTPEWSRRARAAATYAALRSLGRSGVADLVRRSCRHAQRLTAGIGALPGAELLCQPILNQGLVRFVDPRGNHDARTEEVVARVVASGEAWFGTTLWKGMRVMRISVCNWQTGDEDVERSIAAVARAASD